MNRQRRTQKSPAANFGINQLIMSAALFSGALWTVSLFAIYVF